MHEWQKQIQDMIEEIDVCIKNRDDETLILKNLSRKLGYSEFHTSRKFKEISGMQFKNYLRYRRLAFALKEVRDTECSLLEIALNCGFSSYEAFSRAFKGAYGMTPCEYRQHPVPVVLRTMIKPFDSYLVGSGKMGAEEPVEDVKIYAVTIPAHKFLHIRNCESIGYWDFWQKQSLIPGQDYETICGLLDSMKGKLDDMGGSDANSGSGQIMGYLNKPAGRNCSWGVPLAECYGVRLPSDYHGEVPPQMLMMDVPEGEYIVFEHGPFDYESQNCGVEKKMDNAMASFDYAANGYQLDMSEERIMYFFHDPMRYWKYVRPVKRVSCN